MVIDGTVRFPPSGAPLEVAVVRITVRDVTEMDGPAPTVAEVGLPQVAVPPSGLEPPFSIDAHVDDPRRTYAVRAHADRSGSGEVETGDLVTTTTRMVDASANRPVILDLSPVD